jgi:hypothetical protein
VSLSSNEIFRLSGVITQNNPQLYINIFTLPIFLLAIKKDGVMTLTPERNIPGYNNDTGEITFI